MYSAIQEAMERSGIILLIISADFLASRYIFEVELPFALQRHSSGRATVIPVLLRPVAWQDTPIAKLQVLPSNARPVTLWPDRDEAFSDVAGSLREFLYGQRLSQTKQPPELDSVAPATHERVLDAAIASRIAVDEPTDLVLLVRTTTSDGLKAILKTDSDYSPSSEDVRSRTFELDFPADASGRALPVNLTLALESPYCRPSKQSKSIRIPSSGDSQVSVFMLTPTRVGPVKLNLKVLLNEIEIGCSFLVTTAFLAPSAQPDLSYGVVSMHLRATNETPLAELPSPAVPRSRPRTLAEPVHPPSPKLAYPPAYSAVARKIVGILITYSWQPEGQVFPLREGRNLIGRDSDCEVCILEDQNMSGKHCHITFRQKFSIGDLVSMMGTYLNDLPIEQQFESLGNYSSIRAGSTHFIFIIIDPPGPEAPKE